MVHGCLVQEEGCARPPVACSPLPSWSPDLQQAAVSPLFVVRVEQEMEQHILAGTEPEVWLAGGSLLDSALRQVAECSAG